MRHQAVQNVRVSQLPDQPVSEPRQDIFQFLEEWRINAPNLPDDPFGDAAELRHKSVYVA